jgi:hypothetical protein
VDTILVHSLITEDHQVNLPQHLHLLIRNRTKVKRKRRRRRKRRKHHPHHPPKRKKKIWIWEIYSVDLYHLYPINYISPIPHTQQHI